MHKSKMSELIEAIVAEIVVRSGDVFDASGARALLGAQIRRSKEELMRAALPGSGPDPRELARVVNGGVVGPV